MVHQQYLNDSIGRITTTGTITPTTRVPASAVPYGIAAGPDGGMWFTNVLNHSIGRIEPGESTPVVGICPVAASVVEGNSGTVDLHVPVTLVESVESDGHRAVDDGVDDEYQPSHRRSRDRLHCGERNGDVRAR